MTPEQREIPAQRKAIKLILSRSRPCRALHEPGVLQRCPSSSARGCWRGDTVNTRAHPFPPFTLCLSQLRPSPRKDPLALPRARRCLLAPGAASSDAARWGHPAPTPTPGWVNCRVFPVGANPQRYWAGVLKLLPCRKPAKEQPAWATVSGRSQSSDPFPTSKTQTHLEVGSR